MKPRKFSRRQLLGGLLAALAGWLLLRPRRAAAAPRRPAPPPIRGRHESRHVATYTYDDRGRLLR